MAEPKARRRFCDAARCKCIPVVLMRKRLFWSMNWTFESRFARPPMVVGVKVAAAEPLSVNDISSQKRLIRPTLEARTVQEVGEPCAQVTEPDRTFWKTGIAFARIFWRIAMLACSAC